MKIVKRKDRYNGPTCKDPDYFCATRESSEELEEIDLTNIIRRLK